MAKTSLEFLRDTPPWDWPEDASRILLDVLRGDGATTDERLLAAELAGEIVAIDDELADELLATIVTANAPEELRGMAAIALGPVLEIADTHGWDDFDDVPISEETFHHLEDTLRTLFRDASLPGEVRRRVLEASVRAPRDWHKDAVRAAYYSDDESWKLTAVFAMRYIRSFRREILEALESDDQEIRYQAVRAAGDWEIEAAWTHVRALLTTRGTPKPLLLAAIEAAPNIEPEEALELLDRFVGSRDEDIADAAEESILMAGLTDEWEDDEDDEDDPWVG